jgi:hypothetical protein
MLKSISYISAGLMIATMASAQTPITGNVSSKCSIYTDTPGVYGNPTPDALSTSPADGGVVPVIRYDVSIADAYKAQISWPNEFTSSPNLNDALAWDGEVTVKSTSDAGMSGYEAAKIEYENVTEYDMTIAGSTWFEVNSSVTYGVDKPLPGGQYRATVVAECIAK